MRIAAWIFFALAVGFPSWLLWGVYEYGAAASKQGGFVCGMPALAAMFISFFTLVFVGGLATSFAWMCYRNRPKPRLLSMKVEAWFLSMPFIAGAGLITYTFLWFWLHSGR